MHLIDKCIATVSLCARVEHGIFMTAATRTDRFTFYVMTIMSFLESTVPTFVDNLKIIFKDDQKIHNWLSEVWLPEEFEHGELGRKFVAKTWPEFDWNSAYQEFIKLYEPKCSHEVLRSSKALEALCRCVTETEATMFYRCIDSYTDDHQLKLLMKKLYTDEARHYKEFRDIFDHYDRIEKNSFYTKSKTILSRTELTRDEDIKLAFYPLNKHWKIPPPFEPYGFKEFLTNAKVVIIKHFPIDPAKRMLFRPIKTKSWANKLCLNLLEVLVKSHYLGVVAQFSMKKFYKSTSARQALVK